DIPIAGESTTVRLAERHATLRPTSRGKIIGEHPSMREILATIGRVAASSCTVLVTGPSGTGKELIVAALDEAGELPAPVQVNLLRLLQQREYSPVGDSRTVKCNIRVVAATNRDLEQE